MACCGCDKDDDDVADGKKGRPLSYDPDFKGPIRGKARRPKDIPCLGVFLFFIIGMLAIAIYALVRGEPQRIIYPTDSKGRLCGVDEAVKDRPNLLFFDLTKCISVVSVNELLTGEVDSSTIFTCPTPQVCVKECPDANEFGVRSNPVCVDGVDVSQFADLSNTNISDISDVGTTSVLVLKLLKFIREEKCAPYYVSSGSVANRCVPFVDTILEQADAVFNFSSSSNLQELASMNQSNVSLSDLFLNVNAQDILDGSFTQEILVQSRQVIIDVYNDFVVVWPGLILGLVASMIISFIYIFLLRWIAGPMIFTGIALAFLILAGVSAFSFSQYTCFQDYSELVSDFNSRANGTNFLDFINTTTIEGFSETLCSSTSSFRMFIDAQLPWSEYQEITWLILGIVCAVLLLLLFILFIVLVRKICISIAIIKEASKAVGGVPTTVGYPLVTWIFLVAIAVYWGAIALFLLTASDASYAIIMSKPVDNLNVSGYGIVSNGLPCFLEEFPDTMFIPDPNGGDVNDTISVSCQFDQYVTSDFLLSLQAYHLFGLFWISNYIIALGEVTLAGAFASWYWAFNKPKDVPKFALLQSFGRAVLFHSGSIAFGALLIALVQIARVILGYIQKKLKGKTGRVAKAILCMLQCCLWCFEKVLKYINRQAYIEIAIYGYGFCKGACKAVKLLLRNILTTAIKDGIVALLLFLGKVAIAGLVAIAAFVGFGGYSDLAESLWGRSLNYYLLPVILMTICAYLIASGFMTVYHMAVDTIFICALEDVERNNGHDKPYFMSKELMKLLHAKNVNTDQTDGEAMQLESVDGADI